MLKEHIHKQGKSSALKQIVHEHNDDVHKGWAQVSNVSKDYHHPSITGPPYKQNPQVK